MSQFIEMFGDNFIGWKWPVKKLGDVYSVGTGGTPDRKVTEYYDGDIPWVKSTEVNYCELYDTEEHISEKAILDSNCTKYPARTVLLAMYGQGTTRGRVAVLRNEATVNQAIAAIQVGTELECVFLYNLLKVSYEYVRNLAVGGNQHNLNLRLVSSIPIICPPMELQQQFVTIAHQADKSGFDGCKSQFIEMIELKNWPQMKLKDIVHEDCPISYGIVQPGDDMEDGVPIVRPIDMNDTHVINKKNLKHTSREISEAYNRTILRGDEILVCVRGTTGLIALADGLKGCNVTRGITPLFFKPQFNREYLYRAFLGQQVQDYIQDNTIGSTLKGINMSKLRELPICMPPKEVQEQFVVFARQADKSGSSTMFRLAS